MDFHSLPRRELQALCKNNHIPANMTNVAMADALQALHKAGGIESIEGASWNQSPKKAQDGLADLACSSRRASARRVAAPASTGPKEQPASPLPRARRVTAKAAEIRRLISEDEDGEQEEKKEGLAETATPTVKRSTAKQPQGTAGTTRNTRRRASKKEDAEAEEEAVVEAAKIPATRHGQRTTARRGAETPAVAEEVTEDTVVSSRMTTRRTRQSSKSIAADATATTVRRSTRTRARSSAREMENLAQEERAEQVEKGVENENSPERKNDSLFPSCEKTSDLETGDVSDLKAEGVQDETIFDGEICEQDFNLEVVDGKVPDTEGFDNVNELEIAAGDVSDLKETQGVPDETTVDGENELEITAEIEVEEGVETKDTLARDDGSSLPSDDLQEKNIEEGTDGEEGKPTHDENCEQDCNVVIENTDLPQLQLAIDEMIQETEGFNGELVPEVEDGCEGEQVSDQVDQVLPGLKDSPVIGLISSMESLEIAGYAADEQNNEEEEEEEEEEAIGSDENTIESYDEISDGGDDASAEIKEKDEEAIGSGEAVVSSPLHQIPAQSTTSLQRSNTVDLPAEISDKLGDLIGDSEGSPARNSPEAGYAADEQNKEEEEEEEETIGSAIESSDEISDGGDDASAEIKEKNEEAIGSGEAVVSSPLQQIGDSEGSPARNSPEAGYAADEQNKEEEEEEEETIRSAIESSDEISDGGDDASAEIKEKNEEAIGSGEAVVSSPLQQIPPQSTTSLQRSNTVDLPAEISAKLGDLIGDSEGSPARNSPEAGDVIDATSDAKSAGIIFELEKSKDKSKYCDDADKENTLRKEQMDRLAVLKSMSLIKLRTLYKKELVEFKKKVDGRRLALSELNDNVA